MMWMEERGPSDHIRVDPTMIERRKSVGFNERGRVVLMAGDIPRTAHGAAVVSV